MILPEVTRTQKQKHDAGFFEQCVGVSREEPRTNDFTIKIESDSVMSQVDRLQAQGLSRENACQGGQHGKKAGKRKLPSPVP